MPVPDTGREGQKWHRYGCQVISRLDLNLNHSFRCDIHHAATGIDDRNRPAVKMVAQRSRYSSHLPKMQGMALQGMLLGDLGFTTRQHDSHRSASMAL